jgi:hypothetical protein
MPTKQTPLSAAIIARFCEQEGQEVFAQRCGLARTTVAHHCTGERDIRDNHAAAYAAALGPQSRAEFLAAWLRDIMPGEVASSIFQPDSTASLKETITHWRPQLDAHQNSMLDWWAGALAEDPELAEIFAQITRKAGYPNGFQMMPAPVTKVTPDSKQTPRKTA